MPVLVAMPRYNSLAVYESTYAHVRPCHPGTPGRSITDGGSILEASFNQLWAECRNAYEAGTVTHFAMIHSDIGAPPGWVDKLEAERLQCGADVIAAVVPIKDDRGLTSTAIENPADPWTVRRLTLTECRQLPVTFTEREVPGLLLNTGLWLAKLGDWCLDVLFETHSQIRRDPATGKWRSKTQPEDFDFSRQLRRKGLKLAATRAVPVRHYGEKVYSSEDVWGWPTDLQNGTHPEAVRLREELTRGENALPDRRDGQPGNAPVAGLQPAAVG